MKTCRLSPRIQDVRFPCQKHDDKPAFNLRSLDTTNSHKFDCYCTRRRIRDRSGKYASLVQWWWDWVRNVHTWIVCLLAFFLLNLWSPRSSRPPLQGSCRDVACSHCMYTSTAHDLFPAARTSSSARFSQAKNPSSSNSDIMTSTANNSTLLLGSSFDPSMTPLLSPYLMPLQDLDVDFLLDVLDQCFFSFASCPIL